MGLAALAAALLPAIALAWLMRAGRLLGGGASVCAVVGGLIAGVLVGPGVLGRVAPDLYEAVFTGAVAERETRQRLGREQAIEVAVMRSSDVTSEALTELQEMHARAMAGPADAERRALADRADTINAVGVGLAAAALILPYLLRAAGASRRAMPPIDRLTARSAGLLTFALPAGAVAAAMVGLLGMDWRLAAAFGGAAATGWAAPGLRARRMGRLAREPKTDQASSAALGGAMLLSAGATSAVWLAIGAIPGLAGLRRIGGSRFPRRVRRALHAAVYAVIAPGVCAAAAMRVDPYTLIGAGGAALWIAIAIAVVASTDGRWCGATLAWLAADAKRGIGPAMERATAHLASGVGVAQCALALALAALAGLGEAPIFALLIGAALAELSAGAYRLFTVATKRRTPRP